MKTDDSVLVVCGGSYDADILRSLGFRNVTISNLDQRQINYQGFSWALQDAEYLSLLDASFDWVIVNAGLHHCASPHRALLEMYRVSKKGALIIEARDSMLMRMALALWLVPEFEIEAVVLEGDKTGGVRNTAVPNYIYRWTEREIYKTIESAYPQLVHRIKFFYGLSFLMARLEMSPAPIRAITGILRMLANVIHGLLPRQGNKFGAIVFKTAKLKPWMDSSGAHLSKDYPLTFIPSRYKKRGGGIDF